MNEQHVRESSASETKLRRSHRKSRNGCRNCKRRKVKCDEVKPQCTNCVRFGLPCDFSGIAHNGQVVQTKDTQAAVSHSGPLHLRRRGRGRPRRNWPQEMEHSILAPSASTENSARKQQVIHDPYTLNTSNLELLQHFSSFVAGSFSGVVSRTDKITSFWADNVPKIGLHHHFVLYLAFSVTAYHLARLEKSEGSRQLEYIQQAEHYFQTGLPDFTEALADASEDNCGALDTAATLVCYCTFAAGPRGPNDLLICRVNDETAHNWRPVIKGLRLIREMFDPKVLFSGLMAPLGSGDEPPNPKFDTRAHYIKIGVPRLDWEAPLHELQDLLEFDCSPQKPIYFNEFTILNEIYKATYGDANGDYNGPPHNKMVFGWLYRMDDAFVDCVRREDPIALLLLAYFAPLLKTLTSCWFIDGWAEHLLDSISRILGQDHQKWLLWPQRQVVLPCEP